MTKEELEKEANKALDKRMGTVCYINRMNVQIPYTDGYKDSAEPREKRIEELEQENKVLAQNLEDTEILNKTYEKRFSDLEKENAELDCQKNRNKYCYSCANATEKCFRNEVGCPCGKYKSYKDENAELKTKVTALENANRAMVKELDDTTSGGLNILQNVVKNKEELATAKEIINDLVHLGEFNEHTNEEYFNYQVHEALKNAEQFLKDCEVEK